jgi:hypothetical protein
VTGQPEVIQVQKSAFGKFHHIDNDKRAWHLSSDETPFLRCCGRT